MNELLKRWERPNNYAGAEWPKHFVFLGQHRDSDALTRSNFTVGLAALKKLPELTVETMDDKTGEMGAPLSREIIRESHWAVGWVEWIAIHESDAAAIEAAEKMLADMEDYPVLNEEHFSELEWSEYDDAWRNYGHADFIREIQNQFELRDGTSEFLDALTPDDTQGFYESLISSGEYYTSDNSGVNVRSDRAVEDMDRDALAKFIRERRKASAVPV
jgi:hypothetical protein